MIINILKSLRPKQWTKNLCLFAALAFSQNMTSTSYVLKTFEAFLVFCLVSGAIYILNDLTDLEKDRRHPLKSHRPLASGALRPLPAAIASAVLLVACLISAFILDASFFTATVAYILLQIMYSFFLKHIVILDALSVATGFVLRVVAGALVIHVEISSWLLVCTLFLALFLSLGKRRHELQHLSLDKNEHRNTFSDYSVPLLEQMISIVTASTVVSYALYTMSPETIAKVGTRHLIYTIPFVLFGIFRYLYLIYQKDEGGNPENILVSDIPLIINIFLWIAAIGIVLYVR